MGSGTLDRAPSEPVQDHVVLGRQPDAVRNLEAFADAGKIERTREPKPPTVRVEHKAIAIQGVAPLAEDIDERQQVREGALVILRTPGERDHCAPRA